MRPFVQNIDNAVLSRPILMHPQNENKNKNQKVSLPFLAIIIIIFLTFKLGVGKH